MADNKRNFTFPSADTAMNYDNRAATALEFIAHYLDRIDGHLERLSMSSREGTETLEKIRAQMVGMQHLIARK